MPRPPPRFLLLALRSLLFAVVGWVYAVPVLARVGAAGFVPTPVLRLGSGSMGVDADLGSLRLGALGAALLCAAVPFLAARVRPVLGRWATPSVTLLAAIACPAATLPLVLPHNDAVRGMVLGLSFSVVASVPYLMTFSLVAIPLDGIAARRGATDLADSALVGAVLWVVVGVLMMPLGGPSMIHAATLVGLGIALGLAGLAQWSAQVERVQALLRQGTHRVARVSEWPESKAAPALLGADEDAAGVLLERLGHAAEGPFRAGSGERVVARVPLRHFTPT
ncbi:MAG: hypothetical protein ACFCGT_15980 [Sandaracinaceae bacterium]